MSQNSVAYNPLDEAVRDGKLKELAEIIGCDYKMLTLYIDKCKSKNLVPTMAGFSDFVNMFGMEITRRNYEKKS